MLKLILGLGGFAAFMLAMVYVPWFNKGLASWFGAPEGMSCSAYIYALELRGRLSGDIMRPLVDSLFFWQGDHCLKAWERDLAKRGE